MIGSKLAHYRILGKIGEGGMGKVYRAHDTKLGREVAIKLLPEAFAQNKERLARFECEGRLLAALNHPGIATLYALEESDAQPFLVMELVSGETLAERISRGPVPLDEALPLFKQIADGLEAAHEKGIVHRDLKPANIKVLAEGKAKILDFGLAKAFGSELGYDLQSESATRTREGTAAGVILGTAAYMSPDQARGKTVDKRTDIWAFGCCLFEALTGRKAFSGETTTDVLAAVVSRSPDWDLLPENTPSGVRDLLRLCLQKDLGSRLRDVGDARILIQGSLEHPSLRTITAADTKELRGDLEKGRSSPAPPAAPRMRRIASLAWLSLLAAPALLIGLWLGGRWLGLWSASLDPNTVLVLPLEVRGQPDGGDFAGQAFAETLALNLAQRPTLRVLPVPAPGHSRSGELLQASEDARRLRAGRLVHGSLTRAGDRLQATLGLLDTSEGARILWGAQKEGSPQMLSALAVDLARELASTLGAPADKRYEFFYYDMGSAEMAASPELSEAMGAVARASDTDNALRATKRLVERFSEEPQARVLRAMALLSDAQVNPTPAKIKAFQESLVAIDRLDPENPWDDVFRALYLLNAGSYVESVQGLSKILTRHDLTPSAVANLLALRGRSEAGLGNFDAALRDLEKAVRLDPAADLNFYFLSRGLFLAGRKEEALVRARQAVALNENAYDNFRNLGLTQGALGKWPEAVISLRKACELTRGQFECALYALGLIKAGNPATAREIVDKASAMAENRWGTYVLAAYHALTGKRAESVRLLKRSVELGTPLSIPDEPELAYLRTEPLFDSIVAEVKLSEKRKR